MDNIDRAVILIGVIVITVGFGDFNNRVFIQSAGTGMDMNETEWSVDYTKWSQGSSMQPSLYSGYTVLYTDYNGQDLEEGMIIDYDSGDGSITHRILGSYEYAGYVIASGDNSGHKEMVELEDIDGIAVGTYFTGAE